MIAFGISVLYFCAGLLGLAIFFFASFWIAFRLYFGIIEGWRSLFLPENRRQRLALLFLVGITVGFPLLLMGIGHMAR